MASRRARARAEPVGETASGLRTSKEARPTVLPRLAPPFVFVALVALGVLAPLGRLGAEPAASRAPAIPATDAVPRIDDAPTWARLASRPDYWTAARTETVKVILERTTGTLYFLESNRWDLHFTFVRRFLDPNADHATFNVSEYRRPDRRFVLISLVHYLDGDHFTFELVAGDTLEAEPLVRAFEQVRRAVYFGDRLRFRPTGPQHEELVVRLGARLPSIAPDAVMADVRYQPVVVGEAYGYLRRVRGPIVVEALRPTDIVVTEDVPEELPPVAALVTSRLQAPLAHVAVLCRNRGTPDMSLRGAIEEARFTALEGHLVRLRVGPQDVTIEPAERSVAEASWASRRPSRPLVPALDLRTRRIRSLGDLDLRDASAYGAKAAQLGEVQSIGGPVRTPGGFAVPFRAYASHLRRHGLDVGLGRMLDDRAFQSDPSVRAARLAETRAILERLPIDPSLVRDVRRRILAWPTRKTIVRSSTNAEDLPGFNGAGLYESVVLPASPDEATVERAMRRVYASVWLDRAFEEREWYRVDHARVAMGLLVQPFVEDVVANGVAVTVNPFDEARPGVFVNLQTAGGSVTAARGDEVPEQYVVYTWSERPEPEILSRSSLNGGRPILTTPELLGLVEILQAIHARMLPGFGGAANGVDVELLLTRDRRFVVVQARPYRVVYEPGQSWR
ncbi:MAG: PEP/pyruvate-binding domain-containing protein [Polyangiales bacterium]